MRRDISPGPGRTGIVSPSLLRSPPPRYIRRVAGLHPKKGGAILTTANMKDKEATSAAGSIHPELALFHPAVREWFASVFPAPTRPQALGWPAIARGDSTLILAPTGTGKTLAAFLWCINRLMFSPTPPE